MSDYIPITRALRMYLCDAMIEIPSCLKRASSFCDNIDALHKTLEDEYTEIRNFVDRLSDAAERREDVTLWGVEYMALPVDADGVPIRVGDEVTEHEDGHTFKVDGIKWWMGGWWVFQDQGIQAPVKRCTHYHAPIVEDLLQEFVKKMNESMDMYTSDVINIDEWHDYDDQIIAEYAAKLREVMRDE